LEKNEENKIRIFKVSLTKENEFKKFEVGIDGEGFQIDSKDEDTIYFLQKNIIYKQTFKEKEKKTGFGNLLKKNFGFLQTDKKEEVDEDNLFGAEEFFKSKDKLNFIKFDKEMNYFFCNTKKNVKRYRMDNKEVVNVYDDLVFRATQIYFSNDEQFMYRYTSKANFTFILF
jgi:hypothetical protein